MAEMCTLQTDKPTEPSCPICCPALQMITSVLSSLSYQDFIVFLTLQNGLFNECSDFASHCGLRGDWSAVLCAGRMRWDSGKCDKLDKLIFKVNFVFYRQVKSFDVNYKCVLYNLFGCAVKRLLQQNTPASCSIM
jgi:hypothetical protein